MGRALLWGIFGFVLPLAIQLTAIDPGFKEAAWVVSAIAATLLLVNSDYAKKHISDDWRRVLTAWAFLPGSMLFLVVVRAALPLIELRPVPEVSAPAPPLDPFQEALRLLPPNPIWVKQFRENEQKQPWTTPGCNRDEQGVECFQFELGERRKSRAGTEMAQLILSGGGFIRPYESRHGGIGWELQGVRIFGKSNWGVGEGVDLAQPGKTFQHINLENGANGFITTKTYDVRFIVADDRINHISLVVALYPSTLCRPDMLGRIPPEIRASCVDKR